MSVSNKAKAAFFLVGLTTAWLVAGVVRYRCERAVVIRLAEAFARQEAQDARGT